MRLGGNPRPAHVARATRARLARAPVRAARPALTGRPAPLPTPLARRSRGDFTTVQDGMFHELNHAKFGWFHVSGPPPHERPRSAAHVRRHARTPAGAALDARVPHPCSNDSQVKAILISGVGFFTDAYDLYTVGLISQMIAFARFAGRPTRPHLHLRLPTALCAGLPAAVLVLGKGSAAWLSWRRLQVPPTCHPGVRAA